MSPHTDSSSCSRCHFRVDLCLCQSAPVLSSSLHITLLSHERELQKSSNTGRLVEAAFLEAEVVVWQRKEPLKWRADRQPVLLFPEGQRSDASDFEIIDLDDTSLDKIQWILLDATWQQAAKMLRQSPQLQQLPRFSVPLAEASNYQLRKNQLPQSLSTVETVVALSRTLNLHNDAKRLNDYFDRFQCHYEAMRSNHSVGVDNDY